MIFTILLMSANLFCIYAFYKSGYYQGKLDGLKEADVIMTEIVTNRVYEVKAKIIQEYLTQEGIK